MATPLMARKSWPKGGHIRGLYCTVFDSRCLGNYSNRRKIIFLTQEAEHKDILELVFKFSFFLGGIILSYSLKFTSVMNMMIIKSSSDIQNKILPVIFKGKLHFMNARYISMCILMNPWWSFNFHQCWSKIMVHFHCCRLPVLIWTG